MFKKENFEKLLTLMSPKSPISEAYRILRTNIGFSLKEKHNKTILITSAGFECGKSVVTANLGVVMAQAGQRVLIIDSDLRNPQMYKFFTTNNSRGLSNLLIENLNAEGIIARAIVEGLYHLPSGPIPSNPSELLGMQRMKNLLDKVKEQFDTILLDGPPVIGVTDASLLAQHVDGVLLVVKARSTTISMVEEAKMQLEKTNAKILGIVLNEVKIKREELKYHYYLEQRKVIQNSVVITPHLHQPMDRNLTENAI